MIARYNIPEIVTNKSTSAKEAYVSVVNDVIRSVQAKNTQAMCSCVDGMLLYIGNISDLLSKLQLDSLMDKAVALQWLQDLLLLQTGDDIRSSMEQLALGSYLLVIRVARDIRNSAATRKERILQALCGQIRKAKANNQDISGILGILLMKGCFL